MNLASLHQRLITSDNLWTLPARAVLRAASVPYAAAIRLRNQRYDQGAGVCGVPAPVISIGNITTGGTGKTPLVVHVARKLQSMKLKVAILSRGYKSAKGEPADEVRLLRQHLPDVLCVQDPDRVAAAKKCIGDHGIEAIVLDDGFQHRRLARDLDIVTIDATCPFGYGHLIPRGRLREPASSLARANLVVMTRTDQVADGALSSLRELLGYFCESVVSSIHRPDQPVPLNGEACGPGPSPGDPVMCFAGIGNPESFTRTATALAYDLRGSLHLADHHHYSPADAQRLADQAAKAGARWLLTTEKDAAKLGRLTFAKDIPVYVLPVRIELLGDADTILDQMLQQALDSHSPR